jgi:hypothetical protein
MTLKNQAIQTALNGNWQEAIDLNKSLVKENPKDIDALNRLALAYTIIGNNKEAKSTYTKVVNLDPLNAIALRNLKKLKEKNGQNSSGNGLVTIRNTFLEEPGKTKVVEHVNIAQAKITENLSTGQTLEISVKRLKIFVSQGKQYIGVLPDDISRRLIKFIKAGCVYEAFVKSANAHKVAIFVKEIKKPARLKDQPSFTSLSDTHLEFDKNNKIKQRVEQNEKEDEQDESYSDED